MNVLVYNGPGASANSVKQILLSLRSLISDHYDILAVDHSILSKDHWIDSTAMLVMPCGNDDSYSEYLDTKGMERIRQYVMSGGKYFGIGAGASFAADTVSFSSYSNALYPMLKMDVGYSTIMDDYTSRPRFLKFFSGISKGSIVPRLSAYTKDGSRILKLSLNHSELHEVFSNERFMDAYVNGAPWFEPINTENETVLAYYETPCDGRKPAIVHCRFRKGMAVLCGPHIEYDPHWLCSYLSKLNNHEVDSEFSSERKVMISHLFSSNNQRIKVLKSIILKLGLKLNKSDKDQEVPRMNFLHLFSSERTKNTNIIQYIDSEIVKDSQLEWRIVSTNSKDDVSALPIIYHRNHECDGGSFKVEQYFKALGNVCSDSQLGWQLLYGAVVSSTQTILEKNDILKSVLSSGTVFVADHQLLGRGRGHNSWISQLGSLQFSLLLEYRSAKTLIFIQYLFALAVVETIKSFPGYSDFPAFIKWPNDIYTRHDDKFFKLGGILITSSYERGLFKLIIGCGLNISNELPTISLLQVSQSLGLEPLDRERLLASLLCRFDAMYKELDERAFFKSFANRYYANWMHTFQQVRVLNDSQVQEATLIGIDHDSGYLIAEQSQGSQILLHPDGNTFDMMKGLISRKV